MIVNVVDHSQKVLNAVNSITILIWGKSLDHNRFCGIQNNVTQMILKANILVAMIFPNLKINMMQLNVVILKEVYALAIKKALDKTQPLSSLAKMVTNQGSKRVQELTNQLQKNLSMAGSTHAYRHYQSQ